MLDLGTKRKGEVLDSALPDPSTSPTSKRFKSEPKHSPHRPPIPRELSHQENTEDVLAFSVDECVRVDDQSPSKTAGEKALSEPDGEWVKVPTDEPETPTASKEYRRLSYLDQMDHIITAVREDESHLLDEHDRVIIAAYDNLPEDAKELYFKLLNNRTLKYERIDKFNYPYIENLDSAVQTLKMVEFLDDTGPDDLDGWMSLLRRDELVDMAKDRRISPTGKTIDDLRDAILKSLRNQPLLQFFGGSGGSRAEKTFLLQVQRRIGKVIKITSPPRSTFHRLFIIYNRTREWPEDDKFMTNSILTNLRDNARRFPTYRVYRTSLIWPTREDMLSYVRLLQLEVRVARIMEKNTEEGFREVKEIWRECKGEWEECVGEGRGHVTEVPWFQVFTPGWVLTRIMTTCAHALFRLKEYALQVELLQQLLNQRLFCLAKRGKWYDDLVRILHNYVDQQQAADVCCLALEDPFLQTGHRSSIQKRLRRLYKGKMKPAMVDLGKPGKITEQTIKAVKTFSEANRKALWQGDNEQDVNVEELCLQYYRKDGWKGFHSENSIVTTLFGLLFWDIIFDDSVPGVFSSPYQVAPLDLHTEFFYEARAGKIEQRLNELDAGEHLRIIGEVDERERGFKTLCQGVSWKNFTKEDIVEIAECIGGPALSRICRLFAKTYWAHAGGVPDLCIWKPETKEFKLVEVKGQGDRLSDKQVVWLEHLVSFGLDAITLHVVQPKSIVKGKGR
ncbi:hypothetical protein HK097_007432 [Rhizophlyctis rosea]|uniref:Fanconi-associated nuclease n=1 Tax=Rhizophlyctis rosea TaxID=64517 RepID=A0AAD5SEN0_9FUNG|nr:hypothetical protein HK097_007432 [Rhizophlyctis rosea]